MTWMPVWNRPCSSDPVPIFLGPRAVKDSLTDQTDDASELAQQDAQAAPPPENETESVHEAVMAVNNAASTPPTHQR